MHRRSLARGVVAATGGLLIWSLQLALGYALAALACARGWQQATFAGIPAVRLVMAITVTLALAGCSLLFFRSLASVQHARQGTDGFLRAIGCGIAVFSFIGIAWTALILPVPLQCMDAGGG